MLKFELRCSRIEFWLVTSSYLCALLTLLSAGMLFWITLMMLAGLIASYFNYLHVLFLTFSKNAHCTTDWEAPCVVIGQQSAHIDFLGQRLATELPQQNYVSEFLLVLTFKREGAAAHNRTRKGRKSAGSIKLVLWPDSLSRSDNRRIRRYLRFDCPAQ